jgi:hypothetical protein
MTEDDGDSMLSLATFGRRARSSIDGLALGHSAILDASHLPVPPPELLADHLGVTMTSTVYHQSFTHERSAVFAARSVFTNLGLLLAASILHKTVFRVRLRLATKVDVEALAADTAGNSVALESIVLQTDYGRGPPASGALLEEPVSFSYVPALRHSHPWDCLPRDAYDLPIAYIADSRDLGSGPRDTLYGFGSARGAARLAALLLDVGREDQVTNDYSLESEVGIRGVGPGSVELSLHTPDSLIYQQRSAVLGLD